MKSKSPLKEGSLNWKSSHGETDFKEFYEEGCQRRKYSKLEFYCTTVLEKSDRPFHY